MIRDKREWDHHRRKLLIRLEWARENRDYLREIQAMHELMWMKMIEEKKQ